MAEAYAALGINITLGRIVTADDVAGVQDFILRELARRSLTPAAEKDVLTPEAPAHRASVDHIRHNCAAAGFTGDAPDSLFPEAAELEPYISYMKTLYDKNLRP